MAPPLTIRNLTSTPLELKLVERYEAPGTKTTRCLGALKATLISPSSKKLAENAENFIRQGELRVPLKLDAAY